MTITEIENLSFAELKLHRNALIEAASNADKSELASRYVQARTDATHRDEKLSEQGKTIDALNSGNNALLEKRAELEAQVQALTAQQVDAQTLIRRQTDTIRDWAGRLESAERLARARRVALAEVMQIISPVLVAE